MLSRRLQILIDDERLARLETEASRRRVAVSLLVRDAIDAMFPATDADRRAAATRILDAVPMEVSAVVDLRRELDEMRGRRA